MCGIFGVVNFSGDINHTDQEIKNACSAIKHRGPDESGFYKEPGVVLCHRRLSIIDIGGGKQPMSSEDGNVTISYNGEIYNFSDIRSELIQKGHQFKTESDTEVVLRAYIEYKEECFKYFNGMFAVAIWDKRNKTLILARDRMGKKPLYYMLDNNIVTFSSELKSIYALSKDNREIDYESLQDYFTFGYIPTPKTIYKNIFKLEPASYLIINEDSHNIYPYWDLVFKTNNNIKFSDARSNTKKLLEQSVHDRLVSDVPFGAFLSGGIDSSVVVSIMQQYLDDPVKTFSIGFDVAKYNELDDARLISNYIGTDHTEFVLESSCTDIVSEFTKYYDEPFGDSSSLPTYFVSKLAKNEVKMVLTGDGGDEVFGGYKRYSRHIINSKIKQYLPFGKTFESLLSAIPVSLSKKAGRALNRALEEYPDNYLKEVALSSNSLAKQIINKNNQAYNSYDTFSKLFERQDSELNSIYYGDMRTYMLDDILVKVDRMSMANSIELRSPFLDVNLLEYAATLPENFKTSMKMGKLILRNIAEDYVPKEIIYNKKKGFGIPLKEWFKSDLKDMLIDLITVNRGNGILNYDLIDRLIIEHANNIRDNSEILWLTLCFEIWCNEYHNS